MHRVPREHVAGKPVLVVMVVWPVVIVRHVANQVLRRPLTVVVRRPTGLVPLSSFHHRKILRGSTHVVVGIHELMRCMLACSSRLRVEWLSSLLIPIDARLSWAELIPIRHGRRWAWLHLSVAGRVGWPYSCWDRQASLRESKLHWTLRVVENLIRGLVLLLGFLLLSLLSCLFLLILFWSLNGVHSDIFFGAAVAATLGVNLEAVELLGRLAVPGLARLGDRGLRDAEQRVEWGLDCDDHVLVLLVVLVLAPKRQVLQIVVGDIGVFFVRVAKDIFLLVFELVDQAVQLAIDVV